MLWCFLIGFGRFFESDQGNRNAWRIEVVRVLILEAEEDEWVHSF